MILQQSLEKIKKYFAITFLSLDILGFVIGGYLVIHSLKHLGDRGDESSIGIEHVGNITGAPHLISLGLGVLLIYLAFTYLWKLYKEIDEDEEHKNSTITDKLMSLTIKQLPIQKKNTEEICKDKK